MLLGSNRPGKQFGVFLRPPLTFISLPLVLLCFFIYMVLLLSRLLYVVHHLIEFLIKGGLHFVRPIQLSPVGLACSGQKRTDSQKRSTLVTRFEARNILYLYSKRR